MANELESNMACARERGCAGSCHAPCASHAADEVELAARALESQGRFGLTRGFIQHGDVSVHAHVLSVARASVAMADFLGRAGVRVDRASLIRGALLHDYFLYDWHDPRPIAPPARLHAPLDGPRTRRGGL